MTCTNQLKDIAIRSQIMQLESRIEELRLETLPDISAIRNLQEAIEKMRLEIARLAADEVVFCPV